MFKTIVGPDGKVLEVNNIGYPDYPVVPAKSDTYTKEEVITMLDKIRSEIEREIIPKNSGQYDYEAKWQNSGLRMALKVIDKYKTESEVEQ